MVAIVSLALGIAGNASVFSLADAVIFRPLPYPDPDRLVLLGQRGEGEPEIAILSLTSSHAVWADYRERSRTLTEWAAVNPAFFSLSLGDRSVPVAAARVTHNLFPMLGSSAVRGRLFSEAEAVPGGPHVAVLSWEYWRDSFGLDSDPVGEVLSLDGEPYEVIGVVAEGFEFIMPDVDLWLPLQRSPYALSRDSRSVLSVARMAPGATMDQVEAEVLAIEEDLEAEYPDAFRGWTMDAMNLRTEVPERQSRVYIGLVQASVLMVLLIACANISILMVARGRERRKEIAIRTALGAGRGRIVGQLVRESLTVAALGGVLGLVLAGVGIGLSAGSFSAVAMQAWTPQLDGRVVLFALAVTVLSGLLFGLVPAMQAFRANQVEALKEGGAATGAGRRGWVSPALVAAEVTISLVALGVGSVLALTLLGVKNQDPGFDVDGLMTVRFAAPAWKYGDADERLDVLRAAEASAAELRSVSDAALVTGLPLTLFPATDEFRIDARPDPDPSEPPRAISLRTSPDYLRTLGAALLRGRFLEASDRSGEPPVAVVSQAFAERYFPNQDPVGARLTMNGRSREIVGVVSDVRQSLVTQMSGDFQETIYTPLAQAPQLDLYLVLRTTGDSRTVAEELRSRLWSLDPDLTVYTAQTMQEYASQYMVGFDMYNTLFGALGLLALLLASLGTYGVVTSTVNQRRHEIGVRMAIGARPGTVVTMVAAESLAMSALGLLIGALLLLPLTRIVRGVMADFGMTPAGGGVALAAGAVLLAVTLVAGLVPASRAARVDPVDVLKSV